MNSSQLIHWSDYILSSRSSSVLIEAVIANKKIFLLKYLYDEKNYSNLSKYNFIIKINNEKDILKLINKNISISQKERLKCLKNILINYGKEKKMINSYRKFYSNL